jgi:predicted  nucleic acid-binding Zn-ribbon protein
MELIKNREGYLVSSTHRECTNCGEVFEITSKMTLCKKCNSTRVKSQTPEWKMHQRAKQRCKTKNLEFNIEVSDIIIPDICPILGIKLNMNSGKSGAYKNSPSLDRIDNSKGYTKENIQVVSQEANAMKHSATIEELQMFAKWVNSTYPVQD